MDVRSGEYTKKRGKRVWPFGSFAKCAKSLRVPPKDGGRAGDGEKSEEQKNISDIRYPISDICWKDMEFQNKGVLERAYHPRAILLFMPTTKNISDVRYRISDIVPCHRR
jgi:hypothetical protein